MPVLVKKEWVIGGREPHSEQMVGGEAAHKVPLSLMEEKEDVCKQIETLLEKHCAGVFRHEIAIGIEELITNGVVHGNQSEIQKRVHVCLCVEKSDSKYQMTLEVDDEGEPFNMQEKIDEATQPENLDRTTGRGLLMSGLYFPNIELIALENGKRIRAVATQKLDA